VHAIAQRNRDRRSSRRSRPRVASATPPRSAKATC